MIYVVEKPEDMTFAVKYDGEVQDITNIIYMVSARCGYGIAITVGRRKPQQKTGLSNIITIRIAGDGWHGNDVTECLTLHKGDYLIANVLTTENIKNGTDFTQDQIGKLVDKITDAAIRVKEADRGR